MSLVLINKKNGLGILEISPSITALTVEILEEYKAGFRELANDDEVKIIIPFAPSAIYGMSIPFIYETIKANNRAKTEKFLHGVHDFIEEMYGCAKPTLGVALGTHLLGGGLEIFLPCNHLMVSPNTMLGLPETGIGIMPGFGGTAISRIIGVRKAAEMIASAKMYSAEEAFEMKLVDRIITDTNKAKEEIKTFAMEILAGAVPKGTVPRLIVPEDADFTEEELLKYAKGKSRSAIENALAAIRDGAEWENLSSALENERERFLRVVFSPNALVGVEAFMNKQKPKFIDAIGG
jgi:enoyl-CoA hydratase/carnithine racemase